MPQVQPLRRLEIDGKPHLVEDLSSEMQQLIAVYNEWCQDAADARKVANQLQAAVDVVKSQMGDQLRKEQEATDNAAVDVVRDQMSEQEAADDAPDASVVNNLS